MLKSLRFFGLVLGAFLGAVAPAFADITIGLAGPMTGSSAVLGMEMKHGAAQAVADINAAGGVNGQKLVLQTSDDMCDPKQAVSVANKMLSDGVKFIVGHACSASSIPASKVYAEENALMVTPISTNPTLTDSGLTDVFRTCGRDDQQGAVIADYILKHFKGKRIALTHDQSAWGLGIAEEIKKNLNKNGVQEVAFEAFTPGERDYSAFISRLKDARVDVVFLGGYITEVGLITRQMKMQGAKMQVIGGDAILSTDFWAIAGTSAEGVLSTFSPDPRQKPEAKSVVDALRKGGYEPEGYTLYSYAAVQAIADGLKRAGSDDPVMVASALRQSPVPTILGPLTFDAKGDVQGTNYVMYRWHNGKYAEVGE